MRNTHRNWFEASESMRLASIASTIFCLLLFGPYIAPESGLRTEQVAIYGVMTLVLFPRLFRRTRITRGSRLLVQTAFSLLIFVVLAAIVAELRNLDVSLMARLARVDQYCAPIYLTLAAVWILGTLSDRSISELSDGYCQGLLIVGVATAAIALYSYGTEDMSLSMAFQKEKAPWQEVLKFSMDGRYTGVFGQPFEAGLFALLLISVGLFGLTLGKTARSLAIILACVIGLMAWSKVFIFGLFILIMLSTFIGIIAPQKQPHQGAPCLAIIICAIAGIAIVGYFLFSQSTETDRLGRSLLHYVTAGRYTEKGGVMGSRLSELTGLDFLFGRGLCADVTAGYALDSSLYEFLVQLGLLGLLIYSLASLLLLKAAMRGSKGKPWGRVGAMPFVSAWLLASLGAPSLFVNRTGTAIWMTIVLQVAVFPPPIEDVALIPVGASDPKRTTS